MLGPSGSGKTTTLRMIAGFELPTAGRILLHGADVTDVPPFDRDVNTVFQDYALFPHMTRRRQRRATGWWSARSRRRSARSASPRRSGWSASRATRSASPSQLSGGQRQRVALARALVNRPRVLLLDEPLGALDLKLREEMQIELKAIQQEVGITFIYVTHDQEEALTMSDRMAVFNAGRIEQIGAPAEVYERPGDALRGRLRRDLQPAPRRGRRRRSSGTEGTFTIRPEKIRLAEPDAPVAADESVGDRGHPRRRLPRPRHPLSRRPSTPAAELVVTQQNLATTSTEALAQQGKAVRLIWKRQHQLPVADGA